MECRQPISSRGRGVLRSSEGWVPTGAALGGMTAECAEPLGSVTEKLVQTTWLMRDRVCCNNVRPGVDRSRNHPVLRGLHRFWHREVRQNAAPAVLSRIGVATD
jgi:hypothetical protein